MKTKISRFLTSNYDLVVGLVFFVSYRIFFTWLLWHGRTVPPEPDDSYYYLASAKHILNVNTFEDFRLLPFSMWLNFLSIFVQSNLEIAYKTNFYVGPIVMFAAVYYFVRQLESNRFIRLLTLTVIALYSGNGAYHGFYWVVESFYQFALFLVILALLIKKSNTKLYLVFPICLIFIFVHPTSAFLSTTFVIYPIVLYLLAKKEGVKAFHNLIPIMTCLGISFFLYIMIGKLFPSNASPQSFQAQLGLIKDFFIGKLSPVSLPIIWHEYFAIYFSNIITTLTYFVMFAFLFLLKKNKLLAIFLSVLIVVIFSSFIPYGARTLGLLWPITFFIMAYFLAGIWKILQSINPQIKLGLLTLIPLICLLTLATIFNIVSISSMNVTKNYNWNRQCPLKLQDENVFFTSHESMNAFSLYANNEKRLHFLSIEEAESFSKEGNYFVETKNETRQPPHLSFVEKLLTSNITRRNKDISSQFPVNAWTKPSMDFNSLIMDLRQNNLQMSSYQDCGKFQVLKVSNL